MKFRFLSVIGILTALCLTAVSCGKQEEKPESKATESSTEETSESTESEETVAEMVPEVEFTVGGDSEYQSLSALLLELKDDKRVKRIYLNPGVYDIYAEYRALGMATPPDDVVSSDYLDRCVFLPPNTSLVGLGDVTLLWSPDREDITVGEARTWSPLNVRYACEIKDITIQCKYGRYCIHDDSHNAADDRGGLHCYKNVKCIYEYSEGKKGFNNTIGFGFSQQNTYVFEDCEFIMQGCPATSPDHSAFYGHAASGASLDESESPKITVRNCKIKGGRANSRSVRLQCLNRCPLHVETLFDNCEIEGGINLTLYYEDAIHAFDVTLRNSGNPMQLIDGTRNPYPIKVVK